MSELTECNFCVLRRKKRQHGEDRVTVERDEHGWLAVLVDGKPIGVGFMALSDHCVC